MIIAPGKRSAARGNQTKNENLPFSCFAPNTFGAKQEKGRLGFCGRFPRTALVPRLSWAIIGLPFQGGRWSLYDIGSMKWIVRFGRTKRLHLTAARALRLSLCTDLFIFLRSTCLPGGGR